MTIINPNPDPVKFPQTEKLNRYWSNQAKLPETPDGTYNIPCQGKFFKIKKADDYPFGSVAGFVEEKKLMEEYFYPHINQDTIFIDAGAAWGTYTLRALLLGAKRVYAFDPDPRCIKGLMDNAILNPDLIRNERLVVFEAMLGASDAFVSFWDMENARMTFLDNFQFEEPPTFLKIDVEGFEIDVIQGARKTLEKYHPKILMENHFQSTPWYETAFGEPTKTEVLVVKESVQHYLERNKELFDILLNLGYKCKYIPQRDSQLVFFTFCS